MSFRLFMFLPFFPCLLTILEEIIMSLEARTCKILLEF
jgi:hypothetical protein